MLDYRGRRRVVGGVALLLLVLVGCKVAQPAEDDSRPLVVATTTMLEDLARQIGGEAVRVEGIMSPGGDPHLYQPTPGDARRIASSQMVVQNGLFLEGWIVGLVKNAGGERPIVVASRDVEPIRMQDSPGGVDPHFWFDVMAWKTAAKTVGESLVELLGPESEAGVAVNQRLTNYMLVLDELHQWIGVQLETIPIEQRVLVTSHDAFNYFGRAYNIEVDAIQGISTEQEASQRDVANMIELVRARKARAVFLETSVNPALIRQVAREAGVKVAGPLYSDSIGPRGSAAATYVGMVVENVRMITESLGGTYTPFEASVKLGELAGRVDDLDQMQVQK